MAVETLEEFILNSFEANQSAADIPLCDLPLYLPCSIPPVRILSTLGCYRVGRDALILENLSSLIARSIAFPRAMYRVCFILKLHTQVNDFSLLCAVDKHLNVCR